MSDTDERYYDESSAEEGVKYFINESWYEDNTRSFRAMVQSRFCPECQNKLGSETQERIPTIDPKSGRVTFELRTIPFGHNPMSAIRTCCSKKREYITAETPLTEVIFRAFLATSNQPMDCERLRDEIGNYIVYGERPHNYTTDLLERVILADNYYGLSRFQTAIIAED